MKFTNGYWQMKKEIEAAFAVEYYAHEVRGRDLVLYAATRHIPERGATLNSLLLTITLSSPMPDVIGVSIVHFDGGIMKQPYYEKFVREGPVAIEEEADFLTYASGRTKEKVERTAFSVEGERLSYYLFGGGTPKESVRLYAELTGKPALPPAWSFGLWLTTSFTTSYDEKTVTGFIDGMEERNIPVDGGDSQGRPESFAGGIRLLES